MRRPDDSMSPEDLAGTRELREKVRGLDPFIPPAPPFEQIERPGVLAAASVRRSSSRTLALGGLPVGVAAVAVAFVLVLVSGFWGPKPGPGRTTALTPPPTRSIAPSPTAPAVGATSVPPAQPTSTLPPGVVFRGSVQYVAWSPSGTEIAVTVGASGERTVIEIIGLDGHVTDTVSAWDFAWVDDQTYVAIDKGPGDVATISAAFVGHVGKSTKEAIPGDFAWLWASSAGYVALSVNEVGSDHYVIWSPSGLSARRDGVPVAFSPDGSALAVVHYPTGCCAGLPSPEPTKAPGPTTLDIVRTDTGKSVRATGDVAWGYGLPVSFSPEGRMVAFRRDTANGSEDLAVLDIATGKVWVVQSGGLSTTPQQTMAWLDETHLDIRRSGPTGAEPAGIGVVVTYWPANVSVMSVSSRGDVATALSGSSEVVIREAGGKQVTRDLPGTFDFVQLLWSSDGSTLMVLGSSYQRGTPDQVALFKP